MRWRQRAIRRDADLTIDVQAVDRRPTFAPAAHFQLDIPLYGEVQRPGYPQHCSVRSWFVGKDDAGRQAAESDRRRHRPASVDDGTSVCDFDEEEKHHKYSIEAALVHFDHAGKHFNVIDTPGYPDFIGQAIGALRAVETAVIVINAHSGIEVNTRRVFQEAGKAGVGRMIVISKMDTENIDFPKLVGNIQELWGKACVPLNVPIGSGHDFKGVVSTLKPPADADGRADERGGS